MNVILNPGLTVCSKQFCSPVCETVRPSVNWSVFGMVHLFVRRSVNCPLVSHLDGPSVCDYLSVGMSVCWMVQLSVHLSIGLSVYSMAFDQQGLIAMVCCML